jgi:DnaJ-class molecular chaperone
MDIVPLVVDCLICNGHGLIPGRVCPEPCPVCGGKGATPTEEGRIILGFFRLVERAEG